jgi:hypothetical protein
MIPLPDYLRIQQEADVVIMNHTRSQASGNIIAFIKMGKKIYLKRTSTIFALLLEEGIKLFDVDDLQHIGFEEFRKPLTENEAERNSELISNLFSIEGKIHGFKRILKRNFVE